MMANVIRHDLSEMKSFERDLNRLSKPEKRQVMRKGFKQSADMLRDEVKRRAPVKEGILKKDIKSGATTKGGTIYITGRRLSPEKANWIEYGTAKMSPHPFIRPSFDANKDHAEKLCINGIIEAIDQVFIK